MSTRYEQYNSGDAFDDDAAVSHDREISLGTTTVLGIFVALTLVCALFFGFGYSMGRRSTPPILSSVDPHVSAPAAAPAFGSDTAAPDGESSLENTPASKPRPERSETSETPASARAVSPKPAASIALPAVPKKTAEHPADTSVVASDTAPAIAPARPVTASAKPAEPPPTTAAKSPAAAAAQQSYVQVAAISHKEDADLLLASLRRRGYAAIIRQQPQDNLLHIQIGPFATKKDADTMRQRLLTDGYNALVK